MMTRCNINIIPRPPPPPPSPPRSPAHGHETSEGSHPGVAVRIGLDDDLALLVSVAEVVVPCA